MTLKYCSYCQERTETEEEGNFLLCLDCGSNLGPVDSSVSIQF